MEQPFILGSREDKDVQYVTSEINPLVAHQKYDWPKRTHNFDSALRLLSTLSQQDLVPWDLRGNPSSLCPCGDSRRVGGFRVRPLMQHAQLTVDTVVSGYKLSFFLFT